jgi:SAM-dependent methyltransferase
VVAQPAGPGAEALAPALAARGAGAGSSLLDAGCGTGRYARALAALGYRVVGLDRSPDLIDVARAAAPECRFLVADLRTWAPAEPFDAALCRGVLNDLVDDGDRRAAVGGLRRALRAGGVLVADVRDWEATAERYAADAVVEREGRTPRGRVAFSSITALEPATHTMRIRERIALDGTPAAESEFAMRCWTREELDAALRAAGFAEVELDALAPARADRIVAVARA